MSLPRYAEYKNSGVQWLGAIPASWKPAPLKYLADFVNGCVFKPGAWSESGTRIIRIENLNGSDSFNLYDGDVDPRHHVAEGDLLFGWSGNRGTSFGPFVWKRDGHYFLNQHIFKISDSRCDNGWFYWCLKAVTGHVEDQATGIIGMVHVTKGDLGSIKVPIPPAEEQVALGTFLDRETGKIDALIAEQEKLLTLLAEKRQATISHAVTRGLNPNAPTKESGVPWLGEVPAHWEVRRLKTLSAFTTSGPRGWSERITEDGSLFIQSGDLGDNLEVDFLNAKRVSVDEDAEAARTRLADGDIVICITGAKTGNVALCGIIPEPAFVNQHLCLVRPNAEVHSRYLGLALKSRFGQVQLDLSQYGLKQGLSLENIRDLLIVLPPHHEQLAIAAHLDAEAAKFDRLTDDAKHAIDLLKERRSALIAAAVTGKIDVRGQSMASNAT